RAGLRRGAVPRASAPVRAGAAPLRHEQGPGFAEDLQSIGGSVKHIILYGPPCAGKQSIAEELAKATGYALLHNQLTNNLVHEVFPYGHPEFSRLVIDFRSDMYEAAARARIEGIIR